VVAPESGGTKTYSFDLSGYGEPDGVEVSPIFVRGNSEKVGSVTSSVGLASGRLVSLPNVITTYQIGGDYFDEVGIEGIVSWWKFDEGTEDSVGENDGTLGGSAFVGGGVLNLDGSDGNIMTTPYGNGINTSEIPHTYSMWVKRDVEVDPRPIFLTQGTTSDGRMYVGVYNGDWSMGIASSSYSSDSGVAADFEWNHVVVVLNGTRATMYLNGGELYGKDYVSFDFNVDFYVGRYPGGIYDFAGEIDDLMVFNRSLSLEEIGSIYEVQAK
jgi:hypothetical protein